MSSAKVVTCLLTLLFCILILGGCGPEKQESIKPQEPAVTEPRPTPVVEPQATVAVEPARPETPPPAPQPQVTPAETPTVAKTDAMPVAFKFAVGDVTRYKATKEDEDSVLFTGKWPKEAEHENKRNNTRVEVSYTQRIESVDDSGNAVARITLDSIRASYVAKNLAVYDFDNRREGDQSKPMYKLLGKSYTIKLAPTGKCLEVIDVSALQAAVAGNADDGQRAAALFTKEAIEERHGFLVLPEPDKNSLSPGDHWSTIRSFSFRMLGTKTCERVYTLTAIEESDAHKIGVIDMKAIPSAEGAEATHQQTETVDLSQMADNTEEYIGEMRFDLTSGKVLECVERLVSKWTVLDDSNNESEPPALVMTAIRVNRVDKLD
jgi:hypothetical protein